MSNAKDPRIVDIMRVVEKLTDDDDPRLFDPSGIERILDALATAIELNGGVKPRPSAEAADVRRLMAAVCEAANPRFLDVMHAEALEQERINAEIREDVAKADAEKAGAA